MQKTIIFNSFYIAMQKLLNIIAFYIIIGETMWKIAYCEAKRPDLRSKTVAFRF